MARFLHFTSFKDYEESCLDGNEEGKRAMEASTSLIKVLSQPADVSAADWLIQAGGFEGKSS